MKEPNEIRPPKWPLKILRFFLKSKYLEEIEGDMEELFHDNVEQYSLKKARRIYTWEMLKLFRPVIMKIPEMNININQYSIFKNYFKTSIRGLKRNALTSFINIFGLSVAIGICVLVYGFASWTLNTDQFHENKHKVYLTTFFANRDGTVQQFGLTPRPIGEMLRNDFTHIEKVCRVEDKTAVLKYQDNVFHEKVRYADPEFLEMFTFPLKWGVSNSLSDLNSVILSEDMSIKYFGDENPIGKEILMKFDQDKSKAFEVTGVAAAFPKARTIDFDFLINFENVKVADVDYDLYDWSKFVNATLIQVSNPSDLKFIENGMEKYIALQNEAVQKDWAISDFAFEPLANLHKQSGAIRDDISWSSDDNFASIVFLSLIGIFLLALACFNYINIAIVSAAKRLKEIGVRKVIGATRGIVIVQFLAENIVITFFALILGLGLGSSLFIPWFEQMNNFSMDFKFQDKNLWIYLLAILLFTGIASGVYPAFYISRFEVIKIFKGSVKFGKKNPLTKVILGFQLILACILITSAVTFTQNTAYLSKRSWGYDKEATLYADVPDELAYEQLKAVLSQNSDVLSISGSSDHLGRTHSTTVIHMPDREYEVDQLSVDANYLKTMGIILKEGRDFKADHENDKQTVIVNELLVKKLALEQPLGQVFEIDSMKYEIIGVAKDFHNYSFSNEVKSTIFKVAEPADYRYLSMKVKNGSEIATYQALQTTWTELFPETPFQGGHQEDVWGSYFDEINTHATFWKGIAFIAVLLASLGLYGLMTLNVSGRGREFSIKKILGAGLKNIAGSITKQYMYLFLVAFALGAPISYLLMEILFDAAYTYHMPIDFSGVVVAVAILVGVLLATVSTQVRKVSKSNPVKGLKVE